MLLNSKETQFTLDDEGKISWQAQESNPLPGVPVAQIKKGAHILSPAFELFDESPALEGLDKAQVQNFLENWLKAHIATVLEPLVALDHDVEGENEPVKAIVGALYEAMGTMPREDLESQIVKLEQEDRAALRARKVRMGPLLVFLPALNKPAAVRLRGLLWVLDRDQPLPAKVPADGIVSFRVEGAESSDPAFYRTIGYPLYGPRAVRIDMLDRVINAVYDGAKGGQFQAQHKMAEWLGCSITDLYDVLEAMGHKKISDPLEEKAEEEKPEKGEDVQKSEPSEVKNEEKPAEQEKPELATFRLKKGKAFQKSEGKSAVRSFKKKDEKQQGKPGKKPFRKDKEKEKKPMVMSAGPQKSNPEDSPFAILEQLKVKK